METKGGLLKPFAVCEYWDRCNQICNGKNQNRDNTFSCGRRRGLLIAEGYKVIYGSV
jgi:hypothetical protein